MALTPYSWLAAPEAALMGMRNAMPNAILLYGAPGIGLYELAAAFARAMLCTNPGPDGMPCGHCAGCALARAGTHPDFRQVLSEAMCAVYEVPYEAAENERADAKKKLSREIRIHQIRALSEFLALNSSQGGRRIVLVYPADKVRAEAAASLLKSMEEPPEGLTWLLAAEKLDDVLPTIRSRSRLVRAAMPSREEALAFLEKEKVKHAAEALAMAGGAPLAALEAGEDERLPAKTEEAVLKFLRAGKSLSADELVRLQARDIAIPAFSLLLLRWTHDLMRVTLGLGPRYFIGEAQALAKLAQGLDPRRAAKLAADAMRCRRSANHPLAARQVWETALLTYAQTFR